MKHRGILRLAVGILVAAANLSASEAPVTPGEIRGDTLLRHITTLASDEYEGREPGTPGETRTLDYLVAEFKRLGIDPAASAPSYLQAVPLAAIRSSAAFSFTLDGRDLDLQAGRDGLARSFRQAPVVIIPDSAVVFAGYGIVAPEFGWDDYKNSDVRGKTVLLLEGEPPSAEADKFLFRGDAQSIFRTPAYKYELAGRQGAAAVLLIRSTKGPLTSLQTKYTQEAWDLDAPESLRHPAAVEGHLSHEAAERLAEAAGLSVAKLTESAGRRDFQPVTLKMNARFEIKNEVRKFTSHNVIAQVSGDDPARAGEVVVYTAHWDHLGRDPSLAGDQIYNGAIDNAAGVAQLLEIAGAFARASRRPARTILFIATTAEEKGYLGARHYATHPAIPLERTLAAINLDSSNLWGRTTDVLNLGLGLTSLDEILASAARRQDRALVRQQFDRGSYYFASDQIEFARAGIPAIFPSAGSAYRGQPPEYGERKWGEYGERHYHQVSDEVAADWDLSGTVEDALWLWWTGWEIAHADAPPTWEPGSGFSRRPSQ